MDWSIVSERIFLRKLDMYCVVCVCVCVIIGSPLAQTRPRLEKEKEENWKHGICSQRPYESSRVDSEMAGFNRGDMQSRDGRF